MAAEEDIVVVVTVAPPVGTIILVPVCTLELDSAAGKPSVLVNVALGDALLCTVLVAVGSLEIVAVEYTVYVGGAGALTKLELNDSVDSVLTAENSVLYGTRVPETSTVATAVVVVPYSTYVLAVADGGVLP